MAMRNYFLIAAVLLIAASASGQMAVQSGRFSDPRTWNVEPQDGADIEIPAGIEVAIDDAVPWAIDRIDVDGTLRFASGSDTELRVETIHVHDGELICGTPENPITAECRIIFRDTGPLADMSTTERGLMAHGKVTMCGQPKLAWTSIAAGALPGSGELVLWQEPDGWQVGDRIVIAGARPGEDEHRQVRAISGHSVFCDPLLHNHTPPQGTYIHCANLSRSITVSSENVFDVSRRGHMMFHDNRTVLQYVSAVGLGRTDKRVVVSATNPRGRYPFHIHRQGYEHPTRIIACVVDGNHGWGFVNHSSWVQFEDCVAHDVTGAAFVTEAGDEYGSFISCLAIRSSGSGMVGNRTLDFRSTVQDFGFEGHGFWLQGSGVRIMDCVATGQPAFGYTFYAFPLTESDRPGVRNFPVNLLNDPTLFGARTTIPIDWIPVLAFCRNQSYNCGSGILSWRQNQSNPQPYPSVYHQLLVWGCPKSGIDLGYANTAVYRQCILIGNGTGEAIDHNVPYGRNPTFEGLTVRDWDIGITVPTGTTTTIRGGVWDCDADFNLKKLMTTAPSGTRRIDITLEDPQIDMGPDPVHKIGAQDRGPYSYFQREIITVNGHQIFRLQQHPDFVLLPSAKVATWPGIAPELKDKTNQQLWDQYGLAFCDAIATGFAPAFGGLTGPHAAYRDVLVLRSPLTATTGSNYTLKYSIGNKVITDPTPHQVRAGWQAITRTVDGVGKYSWFIEGK